MPPSYGDLKNSQSSEAKEIFAKNRIIPTGGATRVVLGSTSLNLKNKKMVVFQLVKKGSLFIIVYHCEIHDCFIYFGVGILFIEPGVE